MLVEISLNMKSCPESLLPLRNMALNFVITIKQFNIQIYQIHRIGILWFYSKNSIRNFASDKFKPIPQVVFYFY